jgi:adenylate cyclase
MNNSPASIPSCRKVYVQPSARRYRRHTGHGALYADRLDPFAAFKPDDLELISAVAAQTAIAVENARAHERLAREEVARANYSRFLPEYVVKQMLENPDSFKLGGVNQTITILFADIRGFTRISEHAPPEKIVSLLNRYFSAMTDIIFAHGGTLDKYLGEADGFVWRANRNS